MLQQGAGYARQGVGYARQGARTAVDTTRSAFGKFGTGMGMYWRGVARIVVSPMLWLLVLAPVAVSLALYFGATWLLYRTIDPILDWLTAFMNDWPERLRQIMRWGIRWWVTRSIRGLIRDVLVPVGVLLGAFGYVFSVRWLEHRLGSPYPGRTHGAGGEILAATLRTAALLGISLLLWIPLTLIGLIPILKPFLFVFDFFLSGFLFGWLFLTIPLGHYGITDVRGQWRYCWRERAYLFGIGGMYVLVDFVISLTPFDWLSFAATPAAFIGGALLHRRILGLPTERRSPRATQWA